MRIDKFLKVSRILKRRAIALEACKAGKVSVNGKDVKPSYNLKIGDEVEIRFSAGELRFRVLDLKETVKKEEAASLYEIVKE
ncbi:MAG TPA: RNA-binding S4 domain-containing protein [Candidatus Borkfalkia excrementavium]|uniref:RQC P-site tRNA stabilizing factor n=1 Tax=Candidatus Borkfalkia excrementavium TaxID=2838505 RepID=A0A9D1Z6B6_9FIRM|nr:RNA-binding S4 domain-containing protein [Candidatus Borkfalkia excrementavium]